MNEGRHGSADCSSSPAMIQQIRNLKTVCLLTEQCAKFDYLTVQYIERMSRILDITENHLKVLSLYTKGYFHEYYIREICRHVTVSHGAAHNILRSLEEKGVFFSETKGRNKAFRLKKTPVAINHILLAESYKRLKFSEKYPLTDEILFELMQAFDCPLALFGSYSAGEATEYSDIDLLCAGSYDKDLVYKISQKFRIEVNVKKYKKEVFLRCLKEDHLIREMYKNHIYLRCPEFFLYGGLL